MAHLPTSPPETRRLDVVSIGRSSVDLYGEQVGGRLEDMTSFAKYIGGCPTNIAVGAARLGLKSAVITRVGNEHMGRFIREELEREGVATDGVITDPQRLTSLVVLGIRDDKTFPLIFYRENCADSALCEDDIDPGLIAASKAVVVTGTHFSRPNLDAASRKAMRLAGATGARVVFDIDYRPVLWGLTGHGLGEERFVADATVSAHLQTILPDCDVVVGTEEEVHIVGGTTDTLAAIRTIRERAPAALIVLKRGPMGCVAFPDAIPDDLDDGERGPGFPVEVYNVLGAGDAFMAGFLRGYLRDLPVAESCRLANACGAFAVSRHGCAPAVPSWEELQHFLDRGSPHRRLREDPALNQLHWSTTRSGTWPRVCALAFDHRAQLEEIADRHGVTRPHIAYFKSLILQAAQRAAAGRPDAGVIIDGQYGQSALDVVTGTGTWIARPIERPGSIPVAFEGGPDVASTLREWPAEHVVKCLCFYHPGDPETLRLEQEQRLLALQHACRATARELLVEIIPGRSGPVDADTVPAVIRRLYAVGVYPDWWKLPPPEGQSAWSGIDRAIADNDPHCRGVLLLGLDAPEDALFAAFDLAARQPVCKGFAVGRTVFADTAEQWMTGKLSSDAAVDAMADAYARLVARWENACEKAPTGAATGAPADC